MIVVLSFLLLFYIAQGETVHSGERKTATLRKMLQPCVIMITEKAFQDFDIEGVSCELLGKDLLNGRPYQIVQVKGLTTAWAMENKLRSSVTTLFSENAQINDKDNQLIIARGATIKLGRQTGNPSGGKQLSTIGTKTVLVIRVDAKDSRTTASEAELADDVFGTAGDKLNLKSQYNACSYGKLIFNPIKTNSIIGNDGVYTVKLPNFAVNGISDSSVLAQVVNTASASLGAKLETIASHVLVCLPPGTLGSWIAYGYFNSHLTVYNDEWCRYPSAQMHELGHNMNLGHSNEGLEEYGDKSGMMGYSYSEDEKVRMCFNGPHTWFLNWFPTYHVDLPINNRVEWKEFFVGFAEKKSASSSDKMIIRIRGNSDTYIHFNRKIGMNSETEEYGDMVLISSSDKDTDFVTTYLLAKLTQNGTHKLGVNINGKRVTVYITVTSLQLGTVPARAGITITTNDKPTQRPTSTKSKAPTPPPTSIKTKPPTPAPTIRTRKPTPFPTVPPVATPFSSPVTPLSPTDAPVISPVQPFANPVASTPTVNIPSPPMNSAEFRIKSQWSGDYLTLSNNTSGAPAILYPYYESWWSQIWRREPVDDPDFPDHRRLKCKWDDRLFLNAVGAENNAFVVGWELEPDWWSMQWLFKPVQGQIYQIVNTWSGLCLSAIPSADGYVDITVYDCYAYWTQQQWVLEGVKA